MGSFVSALAGPHRRGPNGTRAHQRRRTAILIAFALVASLLLVAVPLGAPATAADEFVAYNDMNTMAGAANPANVTSYTYQQSGALTDFTSGTVLPVTVTGSAIGGFDPYALGGPVTNVASDAYATFNGIVDLTGTNELDAADWVNAVTFENLDPTGTYAVTLSANRYNVANDPAGYPEERFVRVTIEGVDASTAASSVGVTVNSPTSVSFSVGDNSENGYVAKWVAIDPGADGSFSVKSEWDDTLGSQPPGEFQGHENRKGYAMAAFKLETYTPPPPDETDPVVTLIAPADGASFELGSVVMADYSCWDADSGIASCVGTVASGEPIETASLGTKSFEVTAVDNEGNDATVTHTYTVVDTADPVVSIATPLNGASFELGAVVAASFSCSDAGSGIASCVGTVANGERIDTASLGSKSFAVTGTDVAGNDTTVTHTYTVVETAVLDVVVVGGSAVVSDAVVAQLSGLVSGTVTRIAGSNRYATAAAVSKAQYAPGVASVFIATGENFPDALAAGAPAGLADSPILLVRGDSVPSETAAELARLKPARIYVVGGSAVVSDSVLAQLGAYTSGPVARVAGSNRYSTAAAVSALLFKPGVGVVYVATGENFPDALAGGPAGVVQGGPILLTRPGALPGETAAELARLQPAKIVVLGGTAAVSDAVAGQLAAYTSGSVSRYAGSNRYATAAAVSQSVFPAGSNVVFVATGINFPDALAAGPAVGMLGGPILLDAGGSSLPSATAAEIVRLGK